jgi:hypothetical protein
MHKALVYLILSLVAVFRINAQQTVVDNTQISSSDALPDEPRAKTDAGEEENLICPGGAGKPCALLGGRAYYPNMWRMTQHNHTWGEAMRTPAIIAVSALLIGTTVFDIEGTDHCLALHSCREQNPIEPNKVDRPWQYATGMSVNAVGIASIGYLKRRGKGNLGFALAYVASVFHLYYGASAFHTGALPATQATGKAKH